MRSFNYKGKDILFGKQINISIFNAERWYKFFFIAGILLVFTSIFFQIRQHYRLWLEDDVSKYLLPPYQDIGYFLFYAFTRFLAPYLISLAIALLFLLTAKVINKRYQKRFFYPEEPYVGALAIFLTSHPGWVLYSVIFISAYLAFHLFEAGIHRHIYRRISTYWLWLPAAIFVIIIQRWLELLPLWNLLKI